MSTSEPTGDEPAVVPGELKTLIIGVTDLSRVRAFYEYLGWRGSPENDLFARFKLDGAALVLFALDALEQQVGAASVRGSGYGGVTPAVVFPSSEALASALELVEKAGGSVLSAAQDRPWGSHTAYICDPEGNAWEFARALQR